jgi:hypothetical protein
MGDRRARRTKTLIIAALTLIGATGGLMLWTNMPWGIGVGYDSFYYLSAADNLLLGNGLSIQDGFGNFLPVTHYPPLYPLTLAAGMAATGLEGVVVARALTCLLFAMNVSVTGWLVFRYTGSLLASSLSVLAVLFSFVLIDLHLMAMTEPLFLVIMLLALYLLAEYVRSRRTGLLIGSAILAGAAYLTRYIGISLIVTGLLGLALFAKSSWRKKITDGLLYVSVSGAPVLVWYLRNFNLTGIATNRVMLFHPPTKTQLLLGANTVTSWVLPGFLPTVLRLAILTGVILFLLILLVWKLIRHPRYRDDRRNGYTCYWFITTLVIFDAVYIGLLGASLTFFDASTRLNDRILSPIYLTTLIWGILLLWNGLSIEGSRPKKLLAVVGILIFAGFNLARSADILREMRLEGIGFTGREWQSSETIALVSQLPADALLYSNEAFPITFLTGRLANWIPENFDPVKGEHDKRYLERIEEMKANLLQAKGALVVFDSITEANVYAPINELTAGLVLWKDAKDGAIFVSP